MIDGAYSRCEQCPRACGADRTTGAHGFCGERDTLRLATACLHFGEEPPVTVWGGSGTIFITGCTLRCAFCQNYQISQQGMGSPVSEADFVRLCHELQSMGAENINIVTGSHHIPLLARYIAAAKLAGLQIPVAWNSSAYEDTGQLEQLCGLVDIWLPDLKTLNPRMSKRLFAAEDYPAVATRAIEWMLMHSRLVLKDVPEPSLHCSGGLCGSAAGSGKHLDKADRGAASREKMLSGVIVRHLFLPGQFEDTALTLDWLKQHVDARGCVSLMSQYTPVPFAEPPGAAAARALALGAIENRLVSATEDADLRDLIAAYDFSYLFYQELNDDTSWLPDFTQTQPFSNSLATPVWCWRHGFLT